jgi:hypothetical protein
VRKYTRTRPRRGVALLLAIGALLALVVVMLARREGIAPGLTVNPSQTPTGEFPESAFPTGSAATFGIGGKPSTSAAAVPTLAVTLIGPTTAADVWANVLLDRVLDRLKQPSPAGDGFAWWQGSEAGGILTYSNQALFFARQPFSVTDQQAINLFVIAHDDPNKLEPVASIKVDQGALVLTVTSVKADQAEGRWILAESTPDTALQALVIQAAARSIIVRAAYSSSPGQDGSLVLIEAQAMDYLTATVPGPESSTTATAAPQVLPTPTRPPESALGTVIESKFNPVIEAGLAFPQDVVAAFTASHAWTGPLTWRETGPQLNNRPMNVAEAGDLTFLILTPNDPRGPAQPFLRATYAGDVTRFPDELVYFQGQRMNEIIYWFVYYSAQHGGQLQVSYDDFGARQSVTIVGFAQFSPPP